MIINPYRFAESGGGGGGGLTIVDTSAIKSVFGFSVDKPTGTAPGDLLVACVWRRSDTTSPNLATQGFTLLGSDSNAGTYSWLYAKTAGASEPSTYSIANGGHAGVAMVAIRGATAVEDFAGARSKAAPSVTATALPAILFGFWGNAGSFVYPYTAPPSGMTMLEALGDSNLELALASEELAATGATGTRTITTSAPDSSNQAWAVIVQ